MQSQRRWDQLVNYSGLPHPKNELEKTGQTLPLNDTLLQCFTQATFKLIRRLARPLASPHLSSLCPPQWTVIGNSRKWFDKSVSTQHDQFAFGHGCIGIYFLN